MKRLDDIGSRRQLFRAAVTSAASSALLVLGRRSADALGYLPWDRDDDDKGHGHRRHEQTGGSGGGGGEVGCCCLLKGTKVATPAGERPVEDLRIGDDVITLSGPRAVKWIGYRKYVKDDGRAWHANVMPVRVVRSAIDDQVPHCDLYLSPAHCVFVYGVLIPVKHLINGSSIARAAPDGMAAIEYYHLDFDTHEVLFAEGAPVESFMEEDSEREYFSNFVQYERLYGSGRRRLRTTPFAPILRDGGRHSLVPRMTEAEDPLHAAREHLARRATLSFDRRPPRGPA
jgi:hypothetical protein